RLPIKIVGLVANRITHSPLHSVVVVVQHFTKRSAIDHRLVPLKTGTLFPFEGLDCNRPKFYPCDRLPWLFVTFEDLDSVKSGVTKCLQKSFCRQRAGNATAPKFGIILEVLGHLLIRDDIGNDSASTLSKHPKN